MTVRRLTPADATAYRALSLRGFAIAPDAFTSTVAEREAQPLSVWEQRLSAAPDAPDEVHGAFVDGTLVGCAGLLTETRTKTRHKATLVGMFVAPEAEGRGLGLALVQAVLAAARARPGLRVVTLTVTDGNARAEALYARCGFVRFGVEPLAIRDPDTGAFFGKVHMQCDLQTQAL
jgi:RimJ/RimL family protein N-acetyltransferase